MGVDELSELAMLSTIDSTNVCGTVTVGKPFASIVNSGCNRKREKEKINFKEAIQKLCKIQTYLGGVWT